MSRFLINNIWFLWCGKVQSKISCFCLPKTQRLRSWSSSDFVATNMAYDIPTSQPKYLVFVLSPQTQVEIVPRFKKMLWSLAWQPGHKHIMWMWPDIYCINVNMVWHMTHRGVNVLAVCWNISCLYQHMCGRCLLLTCFWHCTRSIRPVGCDSPISSVKGRRVIHQLLLHDL